MFTKQEKKELKQKKARYRAVLLSHLGQPVLADILEGPCRLFKPAVDQETAIRKMVGMEILIIMDLWVGEFQTTSARRFVSKLARAAPEEQELKAKPKEGDKKNV